MHDRVTRTSGILAALLTLAGCGSSPRSLEPPSGSERNERTMERNAMNRSDADLPDFDRFWNYSDPAGTRTRFLEIEGAAAKDADTGYRGELLTQIARTYGLEGNPDEAHHVLNQVKSMLPEGTPRLRVRYLLERGRATNTGGNRAGSVPFFDEAWELARTEGLEFHAVDAAHMLGIVHEGDASIAWNERAMQYAEAASDPRARNWLGALYNNLGWTYHELGRYEDALGLWQKCLAFHEERESPLRPRLIARWTIGRGLRSVGRLAEALESQEALLATYVLEGQEEDGFVTEEIAECLHALGRHDQARPLFARAHAKLAKIGWVAKDTSRLERLAKLGAVGE